MAHLPLSARQRQRAIVSARESSGRVALEAVHRTLETISQSTRPIVVGPWLTEVGYELLYWIPFLAWAQQTYHLDPARFVIVSRGGCVSWYAHVAARYLDLFTWVTPDQFRQANQDRALRDRGAKHFSIGAFDRTLLQRVKQALGEEYALLHPSLLYATFHVQKPWSAEAQARARHQPFGPVPRLAGLPSRYVAVRFYTSSICPDNLAVKALMQTIVRNLVQTQDVVLLTAGDAYDDHTDWALPSRGRLHRLDTQMTPATNLDIQTRVLAHADRVYCTYGGYAYLGPLLGVQTDSFYAQPSALHKLRRHVPLAQRVFASDARYGALSIQTLDTPHQAYACA